MLYIRYISDEYIIGHLCLCVCKYISKIHPCTPYCISRINKNGESKKAARLSSAIYTKHVPH